MPDFRPENSRQAIITFHFADRLKAELLLASRLLSTVMMMKEPDQAGARHLFLEFMRGLDQEMAFGQSLISDQEMIRAKTVMTGLLGMIDSNLLTDIQPHLTWLISTMTTYAQRGMEFLMQEKLL